MTAASEGWLFDSPPQAASTKNANRYNNRVIPVPIFELVMESASHTDEHYVQAVAVAPLIGEAIATRVTLKIACLPGRSVSPNYGAFYRSGNNLHDAPIFSA